MRLNKLGLTRDFLFLSPVLFLLVQTIIPFCQNPFGSHTYNIVFWHLSIHVLTVLLCCLQLIYTFIYFRHIDFKYRMVLPYLFLALTLHVYEQFHAICYYFSFGFETLSLWHFIFILGCVLAIVYFQKTLVFIELNEWFFMSLFLFFTSMIFLFYSGFFQQLYVDGSNPHGFLWATGKTFSFLPFVAWYKK